MTGASSSREHAIPPLTRFTFWLLCAIAWGCVVLYFGTARGHLDFGHDQIGRDFMVFWVAGHLMAEGHLLQIFPPESLMAAAHRLLDPVLPFHFWSYPPTALFNVVWLGHLDYVPALVIWNAAGLVALAAAARAFLGRGLAFCLLMVSPAVAANLVLGQNGCLTAALMFAGFAALERRPLLAGAAFGLLGFKPQIATLLPVGLLAGRRWLTIAAGAATALAMAAASAAVFGLEAWRAFLEYTAPTQARMMVGTGPFRLMTPSAFMSGLILTNSPAGAMAVQAPFTILGVALAWRAFRYWAVDLQAAAAAVMVATFIASPQSFNYDMIPVAAAALVMVRRSPTRTTQILAAILWIGPLLVMPLNAAGVPVMPLFLAAAGLQLDRILTAQRKPSTEARRGIARQNA
jgi:Glycosyltransferase family 87